MGSLEYTVNFRPASPSLIHYTRSRRWRIMTPLIILAVF